MKIIYQPSPKRYYKLGTLRELLIMLPCKRYDKIYASLGRGIILESNFGDDIDKEFVVIPYASRNRVVRLLNNLYCKARS